MWLKFLRSIALTCIISLHQLDSLILHFFLWVYFTQLKEFIGGFLTTWIYHTESNRPFWSSTWCPFGSFVSFINHLTQYLLSHFPFFYASLILVLKKEPEKTEISSDKCLLHVLIHVKGLNFCHFDIVNYNNEKDFLLYNLCSSLPVYVGRQYFDWRSVCFVLKLLPFITDSSGRFCLTHPVIQFFNSRKSTPHSNLAFNTFSPEAQS